MLIYVKKFVPDQELITVHGAIQLCTRRNVSKKKIGVISKFFLKHLILWDVIYYITMDARSVTILIGPVDVSNLIVSIPMFASSASRQLMENSIVIIRAKKLIRQNRINQVNNLYQQRNDFKKLRPLLITTN
jgi:hypothetical protein